MWESALESSIVRAYQPTENDESNSRQRSGTSEPTEIAVAGKDYLKNQMTKGEDS